MFPRLPLAGEPRKFAAFSKAGRSLAELHLNYEQGLPAEGVKIEGYESNNFSVQKMHFPSKDDKSTIMFNQSITISNIPSEAYRYIVSGKSATRVDNGAFCDHDQQRQWHHQQSQRLAAGELEVYFYFTAEYY